MESVFIAGAVGVVLLLVYWETAASMVGIWYRSQTFAHGFLVLPLSAWLIWRGRAEYALVEARPCWAGLLALGAVGFVWLLAELAAVAVGGHLALVLMLQAAALTVVGLRMARAMAFPLVFLLFAVPAGEFLVPTLIDWTADFTVAALRASGIPVYREGNYFMIPSGSWSVVESCSGIRYLIASLMVGTLYAYLTYRSALRRAAFIGVAIVVPIVANWLRAYLIIMIGHLSGNQYAVGVDHLIYGWIFFGVVVLVLFWVGSLWREDRRATSSDGLAHRWLFATGPKRWGTLWVAALAAVLVAGGWRPIAAAIEAAAISDRRPELTAVEGANGWNVVPTPVVDWKPRYSGHRAELQQTFERGSARIGLYVAYYRKQEQGQELVNSENVLVRADDVRWRRVASGVARVDWLGSSFAAHHAELSGDTTRLDVLDWYWIDGHLTTSAPVAKLLLALAKLWGRGDDSAVVVVYTVKPEGGSGLDRLRAFVRDMSPSIERALAAANRES